jgi:Mlc titration factor MtfA (ptsG expression regulator)
MSVAFEDHRRAIRGNDPDAFFTRHAADSEAEFFAAATEAFYCCPVDLKEFHAELYQLLATYYEVDPIRWFAGRS